MGTSRNPGNFYAVIPAGGSGTRLWPMSRTIAPKYLHRFGPAADSMLQETAHRLETFAGPEATYVVCGGSQAASIARQLPLLPTANIVVEPSARNSGPAIGLAAAIICAADPDAIMGSFAADHLILNVPAFHAAVRTAIEVAATGKLVTIGITPTRPETGYGYIKTGVPLDVNNSFSVDSFREKPELALAREYVTSGEYLWNAGMFIWRAADLLAQLDKRLPELGDALRLIATEWQSDPQLGAQTLERLWPTLPSISVDHAVMEGAAADGQVAVVPADLGWSDVGDWETYAELSEGRPVSPDTVFIESKGSVAMPSSGRTITVVGVPDVVVVDTDDAVLVVHRESAQLVKSAVDEWRARGREDLL